MSEFGIMQGRLSPSQGDRLQFFPDEWEKEFEIAKNLGFSSLEWVFDWSEYWKNPVWYLTDTSKNLLAIRESAESQGICIVTACFDYLMKYTLLQRDNNYLDTLNVLQRTIPKLAQMGVNIISIPLLENASVRTEREKDEIRNTLNLFRRLLDGHKIDLSLETEMAGEELRNYIDSFENPRIGVCYDTGNSTTLEHDLPQDIRLLGNRIKEVHLKDRKFGSRQSVYLGTGDVDFDACFSALKSVHFNGPYILQAWRGTDYLNDAKRQLEYVRSKMQSVREGGQT